MTKRLVIVESPTKAKTLKKFLGKDYLVTSSVGHIRDLPPTAAEIPEKYKKEPWARLGVNVDEDFAPLYVVSSEKKKVIRELKDKLKQVDELLLATDEDREGEAISWHLLEVLKPKIPTSRLVFHEITKEAIQEALSQTRPLDTPLVEAQEARRIIDRLYGYEVSPILWRKIAPRLSAGRVQSVAIRMLVERELERMAFVPAHYWDLAAEFASPEGTTFPARLNQVDGKRLASGKDFEASTGKLTTEGIVLLDAAESAQLVERLQTSDFKVISTEEKPFSQSPSPPFTTSTLQQEGNRKLNFDSRRTMRAAQRLYELGFITYMRTDSVNLAPEAIRGTRQAVSSMYGEEFLPSEPRTYKTKVKNAQEAHEAIRPAGETFPTPSELGGKVSADELKLYELIWKRTMACQMKNATGRRMVVRIGAKVGEREVIFQASGRTIDFHGYLRAYVEGSDDPEAALADREVILPALAQGDAVSVAKLDAVEHITQPPARLTEASLVKTLEESGIGRPSTYASIIDTIQRREYTFKKGNALVPTYTAFAVVKLMTEHFTNLVDPSFTAGMEDRLDSISRGEHEALPYLKEFYFGNGTTGLKPLLEQKTQDIDPRSVCSVPLGTTEDGVDVVVRVGKYGPFLQAGEDRASVPDGSCPDEVTLERAQELLRQSAEGPQSLGDHPELGLPIYVKVGRFGPYVQLGDVDDSDEKPKMVSLLKGMTPEDLTLQQALDLLSLPRTLGKDADGVEVTAHYGRYGAYIKRAADTRSLEAEDDVLKVTLERAFELLAQEKKRGRRTAEPIKTFENVEALDGIEIKLLKGRYGPYVSDGETNASLPRDYEDAEKLTVEEAVQLILDRRAKGPSKKKKKKKKAAKKKKKASKKKSAKKKTSKKKASKKKAAKKKTSTSSSE